MPNAVLISHAGLNLVCGNMKQVTINKSDAEILFDLMMNLNNNE